MVQNVLGALASANSALATSQLSLASGKKVNSVNDGPSDWAVARRAEDSMRANTRGDANSAHSMDVLDATMKLYQSLETDLQRLNDIMYAWNDPSANNEEKLAYESEASQLADKWSGDAVMLFTYNGYNLYDQSLDFANVAMGEGANSNQNGAGEAFTYPNTTNASQSPGTIWDFSGIAAASLDNSGTGAANTVDLSLATSGAPVATALASVRYELSEMAIKRSVFANHIDLNQSVIAAQDGIRGRSEDTDTAAQTVKQTKLAILQQIATAQTAAGNTASRQVLGLF